MRFVHEGPDVPDDLLFAQEEGRVVFFVGSGISVPAGLPSFKGLVDRIYKNLRKRSSSLEQIEIENGRFDRALHLLEDRIPDGKTRVRMEVHKILERPSQSDRETLHRSLLILASDQQGRIRIVTTNFDRLFESSSSIRNTPIYSAPNLPSANPRHWNGIVYLHGILPNGDELEGLESLVLTSSDFGRAYLADGWATRFLVELFKNYVVCFVGYSIGDSMLIYWMDALATNPHSGQIQSTAYAFVSVDEDRCIPDETKKWRSTGVTPIPYEIKKNANNHKQLESTIHRWAGIYRDGLSGKRSVLQSYMTNPPAGSDLTSFANTHVLWALADQRALSFVATLDPVPPIQWLDVLKACGPSETDSDLLAESRDPNIGKGRVNSLDQNSLENGYRLWCVLFDPAADKEDGHLIHCMARWLTRHLDNPDLATTLAARKHQLNPYFRQAIRDQIDVGTSETMSSLEESNAASDSNPRVRPAMRKIWNLFLSGKIATDSLGMGLFEWKRMFKRSGYTCEVRKGLRSLLAPRISIRPSLANLLFPSEWTEGGGIASLVDWDAELNERVDFYDSNDIRLDPRWRASAALQMADFTPLLVDLADLLSQAAASGSDFDGSTVICESIGQNGDLQSGREAWILIQLARDSWLELADDDPVAAADWAGVWMAMPQPIFRRLALFAATTKPDVVDTRTAVKWLLSKDGRWLWSQALRRELVPLLTSLGDLASETVLQTLTTAILKGPPQSGDTKDVSDQSCDQLPSPSAARLLSALQAGGAELDAASKAALTSAEERGAVPTDVGVGHIGGFRYGSPRNDSPIPGLPRGSVKLADWIKRCPENSDHWTDDGWQTACRERPEEVAKALSAVTGCGKHPVDRWDSALRQWSLDEEKSLKVWPIIAKPLAEVLNDSEYGEIHFGTGVWLQTVASSLAVEDRDNLRQIVDQMLDKGPEPEELSDEREVFAIVGNDSVALAIEGLLRWQSTNAEDQDATSLATVKDIIGRLCDFSVPAWRYGRIQMVWHLNRLIDLADDNINSKLVVLFDWNTSGEVAREMWIGLLAGPSIHTNTLRILKSSVLETSKFINELGTQSFGYATLLVEVALQVQDEISDAELYEATERLPCDALQHSIFWIARISESIGEKGSQFWQNRIVPYFKNIWPHTRQCNTETMSRWMARLCLAHPDNFEDAVDLLRDWLLPFRSWDYSAQKLEDLSLIQTAPNACKEFLSLIHHPESPAPTVDFERMMARIESIYSNDVDQETFRNRKPTDVGPSAE